MSAGAGDIGAALADHGFEVDGLEVDGGEIIRNNNGAELYNVEIFGRRSMAALTLADVDGDGTLEIILSLKDTLGGGDGGVQIWDVPGAEVRRASLGESGRVDFRRLRRRAFSALLVVLTHATTVGGVARALGFTKRSGARHERGGGVVRGSCCGHRRTGVGSGGAPASSRRARTRTKRVASARP